MFNLRLGQLAGSFIAMLVAGATMRLTSIDRGRVMRRGAGKSKARAPGNRHPAGTKLARKATNGTVGRAILR